MKVQVLYFDGGPHWSLAQQRLQEANAALGTQSVDIELVSVASAADAERLGFRGSPTILIDGHDPFAGADAPTALACRVYATETGPEGAPSVAQLRRALEGRRSPG